MPLPPGDGRTNVPWPPHANRNALDKINTWSTWYTGDPDELSRVYERLDQRMTSTGLNIRPSQYRGGIVGWMARSFWGAPPSPTEPRAKLHMPLPADIATVSSNLLFADPITIKAKDTETQDKLTALFNDTMHARLLESAEGAAGLGGTYLRAVWDKEVKPKTPWAAPIDADAAIPVWSYGELREVTFYRVLKEDNNVVVRHLEHHAKGYIEHGVYQGTPELLGRSIPLTEFPETANLVDDVVDGGVIETGIDLLTAVYIPNMRPSKLWRNEPANRPLGRSDYLGIEGVFDMLDETYSSWMRDLRLAKGRVFVPSVYLETMGPGKGSYWNPEREIYEALNMMPGKDQGNQITIAQFDIRVEKHERTADHLMKRAIGTAGYSGQSFGLEGEIAVTATEVGARKEGSLATRDKKINYWRPAIADISQVLAEIGRVHFGWNTSGAEPPEVIFPEAVQLDPEVVARTVQLLDAARAISIETKVIRANPDRKDDKDWIAAEVKRIKEENQIGATFTNPDTFRGDPAGAEPPSENGDKPPAKQKQDA